jgi:iron complex outermembrane receptor protein
LIERIRVEAERPLTQTEAIDEDALGMGLYPNVAVAALELPGVAGVRRSLNAPEPVVRGLGWERVQTQVDGVPLHGACPARMDPPAIVVSPVAIEEAVVVKGLGSVSLGPAGTGGRLLLSTDYDRGSGAGDELHPWVRGTYNGAQEGYSAEAGIRGGTERFDYSLGIETLSNGDYESADGTLVPAGGEEQGGSVSLGYRPATEQRVFGSIVVQDGEDLDYPALPMDTDSSESRLYNVGYRYTPTLRGLIELGVRLGAGLVDHVMSNRRKPNRGVVEAEAISNADSASVGLDSTWRLSERSTLTGGLDYSALGRDAVRQRYVVADDKTHHDHLWPDVSQDDTGIFVEYQLIPRDRLRLRLGARFDHVASQAAAADDPSLGGNTIRESYVRFYGPEAAKTDRDENLPTANAVVYRDFGDDVTFEAGVGLVSRAANMTERYFAFAPAPNGFMIGNPALDAEQKRELVLGATFDKRGWNGTASVYYYSFSDYINPTVLQEIVINNIPSNLFGFENVDATVYGGEIAAVWQVSPRIDLPLSLAYVYGNNDTDGTPLAQIPAPELRAAATFDLFVGHDAWIELGGRFVARQDRVDPDFDEDVTPSYEVWHLRAGATVGRHVDLRIGIENLFDKEYAEHLSMKAIMPVGDLARGQKIPQPGRSLIVSARLAY